VAITSQEPYLDISPSGPASPSSPTSTKRLPLRAALLDYATPLLPGRPYNIAFPTAAFTPELQLQLWQTTEPLYLQFTQLPKLGSVLVRDGQLVTSWAALQAATAPAAYMYSSTSLVVKITPSVGSPQKDALLQPWAQGYATAVLCYSSKPLPTARAKLPLQLLRGSG
jgi:hypothetical protein